MPYIGNIVQDFSVNNAMLNTDSVTSIKIDDGTIVNADINDSAAIAMSKLALSITNSEINASAAIAGSKISPDFGSQNIVTTGTITSNDITISDQQPRINFTDTNGNPDYLIQVDGGHFLIHDATNGADKIKIQSDGHIDITPNTDFGAGIDVTGAITGTAGLSIEGATVFNDAGADVDFRVEGDTDANLINVDAGNDLVNIGTTINFAKFGVFKTVASDATINSANAHIGIGSGSGSGTICQSILYFAPLNGSGNRSPAAITAIASGNTASDLAFFVNANNNFGQTPSIQAMRINSSGNVGIGTTNPVRHMHLNGSDSDTVQLHITNSTTGTTGSDGVSFALGSDESLIINQRESNHIALKTSDTERMRIASNGLVSIGKTSNAGKALELYQAADAALRIQNSTTGTGSSDGVLLEANGSDFLVFNYESGNVRFGTANSERMRIDSSGNVAIGTTSTTMNANGLKVFHTTQPGIQLQNNNSGTTGSDGAEITLTNGGTLLIGNREAGNRIGLQTVASGGSTLVEVARFEENKKCSFNGSNTTACDIDIEGQIVEIGNPLGNNVSAGQLPVFRAEASNSNKNIVFSSMWGGDNAIHKHMEFSGGANIFYVGTDDSEIARTNGSGLAVGTANFSDAHNTDDGIALKKAGNLIARCTTTTNNVLFTAKTIDTGSATALKVLSAQTQVGSVSFNSGGTSFNTSSDYRRKENIVDLTGAITRLKTLLPKRFNFKDESNVTRDGFLAHEVTTVPEAVTGIKDAIATEDDVAKGQAFAVGDPIYQQLDQSKLVPLLVAAVKELIGKVEALEAA